MKQFIASVYFGLGLCSVALANGSPITPLYVNYGVVDVLVGTPAPVVDAYAFVNEGYFEVDTSFTSDIFSGNAVLPYMTHDTLYYTNASSGEITGAPGYEFVTTTSKGQFWASFFLNQGTVTGVDTAATPDSYTPPGGAGAAVVSADSQPLPGVVMVLSTNIVNQNILSVGNCGYLRLFGNNVTNAYGAELLAGAVNTGSDVPDPLDNTGGRPAYNGQFAVDAPGTYDLLWEAANGANMNLGTLAGQLPDTAGLAGSATLRDGTMQNMFGMPVNENGLYASYGMIMNGPVIGGVPQIYVTMVCVNTNFVGATNITANVGFGNINPNENENPGNYDGNASGVIVQFAEPVFDVITGETVTNAVYLVDSGAYLLGGMTLFDDASVPEGYGRPNAIDITTTTPDEWLDVTLPEGTNIFGAPALWPIDDMDTYIYTPGIFSDKTVAANIASYGVQIGQNPEVLDGSFFGASLVNELLETNVPPSIASDVTVLLPDPTNQPGRIEINADNLDLTQGRMRAEGIVEFNVTNLTGGGTGAADFGQTDSNIGETNGVLVVSNFFPSLFQRMRGNIYAWEANWVNLETNNGTRGITNNFHYHLLVVDQNLQGSFFSTIRNLALHGKKSITVLDNLYVINQCLFDTTNLSLNGTNTFTQNAENLTPANMPNLKNLFINTNAVVSADSTLVVGFNVAQSQSGPVGRTYTVNTLTNFGLMESTAPLLQASNIENDGTVMAELNGSIDIEANFLGLGLALLNDTNYITANGNVTLSANFIQATNSHISAGEPGYATGSLLLYAPSQLTDFVSGTPTTSTNSVIVNNWTVNGGGFSLPVKPASGDLFGTEITTTATNYQQADHVWAGEDRGATPAGFANNEVIGRLVLDRQSSGAVLRFSAAGARNAMYVDYLELTNFAYSDYRNGLEIDPNFTIYFADSNADPNKLAQIYPNLIWVTNFVGPNSVTNIPYFNSSISCLMNAGVANSLDIAFWGNEANYYVLQQTPYLLNNPTNWTDIRDCPGTYNFPCNCTPGTNGYQLLFTNLSNPGGASNLVLNLLTVSSDGLGTISPALEESQLVVGHNYTLTAKAATGWVFDYWTTAELGSVVTNYSPTNTFAFVTNTVVTATFIPTPFPGLKGSYYGLFFETNVINPGSSGSVSLTLASSGNFSGKLLIGPSFYTFNSQFTGSGAAQFLAKSGAQSLTVNLQLDITGQTGQILGDVNGGTWDAALAADIAPTWTAKNPSPLAGSYTMALPWDTGTDATNEGGGDSYGAGAVTKLGVLTLAGTLADGAAFSASAPVSQYGQWPLYFYVASGKDTVLGWVTVSNGLSATNVSWSKASGKGPLYPAGFTNLLQLVGSPWEAPAKLAPALDLTLPFVSLSGGDLPEPLTIPVALHGNLIYSATNLSLSVSSSSGSFSGWFDNPFTGRKQTMSGVVLTNEAGARGYFLGTNESGAVLLQGSP